MRTAAIDSDKTAAANVRTPVTAGATGLRRTQWDTRETVSTPRALVHGMDGIGGQAAEQRTTTCAAAAPQRHPAAPNG